MKTTREIRATLHPAVYQPPIGVPVWHSAADAAFALGCSVRLVRQRAAEVGVKRIAGHAVAGMVELEGCNRGYMPYAESF